MGLDCATFQMCHVLTRGWAIWRRDIIIVINWATIHFLEISWLWLEVAMCFVRQFYVFFISFFLLQNNVYIKHCLSRPQYCYIMYHRNGFKYHSVIFVFAYGISWSRWCDVIINSRNSRCGMSLILKTRNTTVLLAASDHASWCYHALYKAWYD